MGFLERINRILVSALLVLVFVQVGLLFFLKSLKDEAQYRLVKNTSKAELHCGGDQFSPENYWSVSEGATSAQRVDKFAACERGNCENSFLTWDREAQERELHVVSVVAPPPLDMSHLEQGGIVRVRIKKSVKKQILALISRSPLEWSLDIEKGALIEKVIVATPTTVWLQGIDAKIPIEYLPKEKMCSYASTWEDAYNPENEFRVLLSSLQKITSLSPNSFQGAQVGREFWIPRQPLVEPGQRGLASVGESQASPSASALLKAQPLKNEPVEWERENGHVIAAQYTTHAGTVIPLPEKTAQVLEAGNQVYAVIQNKLHQWQDHQKMFTVIYSPTYLPEVADVMAIAYDSDKKALVVYNDDRGGEFYRFSLEEQKWDLFKEGFKYNLSSLYYDDHEKTLVALVYRGSYVIGTVSMDEVGKNEAFKELKDKIPFDRKRWHVDLNKSAGQWRVKMFSPQSLSGEWMALN